MRLINIIENMQNLNCIVRLLKFNIFFPNGVALIIYFTYLLIFNQMDYRINNYIN